MDSIQRKSGAMRMAKAAAAIDNFEAVARDYLSKTSAERAASTQKKNVSWLDKNIFPEIGAMPI